LNYIYDDYKNSLLIQKFLKNMVKDSVTVTEDEIKEKMLQIRSVTVRHILLTTNDLTEKAKLEKRKKIENILKRVKKGENFSQLAKEYSEDAGTAKNGGLIKNIKPDEMVQPFDNIAFSLAIGEISDIFETQFGYHILTVIDRRKEDRTTDEIRKELVEIKQKKLMPSLLRSLKEDFEFKEFKI
jgi:parvulin-like peptidyl-prolyl isomerase